VDLIAIGGAFGVGLITGLIIRKAAKVVLVLIAALALVLLVLSHYGIVTVDWGRFVDLATQLFNWVVDQLSRALGGNPDTVGLGDMIAASLGFAAGIIIGGKV